jgi:hypothetical protein
MMQVAAIRARLYAIELANTGLIALESADVDALLAVARAAFAYSSFDFEAGTREEQGVLFGALYDAVAALGEVQR